MNAEKWETIKSKIKDNFKIIEDYKEDIKLFSTRQKNLVAYKDVIVFIGPMGKMMVEYIVKPLVIDKKEHYSTRMGTNSKTEYFYSEEEQTRKIDVYKDRDGEWEKINNTNFSF